MDGSWILRNRYNPANIEMMLGCCQLLFANINEIIGFGPPLERRF